MAYCLFPLLTNGFVLLHLSARPRRVLLPFTGVRKLSDDISKSSTSLAQTGLSA